MKRSSLTHFALFQKYRCGTSSRAGPPCSACRGAPSKMYATIAFPSVRSAGGTFVVYPPSDTAIAYAAGTTPFFAASASSVSTDTPSHRVLNFDHFVTQWISVVRVVRGSDWNSFQLQRAAAPSAARSVKSHVAKGVCGVGPAERTGKSRVSYWPGGKR